MNIQKMIDEIRSNATQIHAEIVEVEPQADRWPEVILLAKAQFNMIRSVMFLDSLLNARRLKQIEEKAA